MKPPFEPTARVRTIEYAIRDVIEYARRLEETGREIIYLNIGDPVKFDFDTPEHVKLALFKAVNNGANWYAQSEGIRELREAISKKEKHVNNIDISPENIIITTGVSEGIFMLMAALVSRGSEMLVPGPTYPPYTSYIKFFEGHPVAYKTIESEGWRPDVDNIKAKITEATKGIVIINPNNPTGAVYDSRTVKEIVDLANEYDLVILSDEIYDRIVYGTSFASTSFVAKDYPVIGLNGFSKTYLATGWRLGYIYFHGSQERIEKLKESIKKESRIRLCVNTPIQKAGIAALNGPQNHFSEMMRKLRRRRDYIWKRLNQIEGLSCTKPKGAFYVFPKVLEIEQRWRNDLEFVRDVVKSTGILFVHGSGFCSEYGSGHFRGVFLPPVEVLEKALDALEKFMQRTIN